MKNQVSLLLLLILAFQLHLSAQTAKEFKTVHGKKARYTISIPLDFQVKQAVGLNIDLNFVDNKGNSINTIVMDLPPQVNESDIGMMAQISERDVIYDFQAMGMQNVKILNRGIYYVNGVETYFLQMTSTSATRSSTSTLFSHSIAQFRNGKFIQITFNCDNNDRGLYQAHINRIFNSFKIL